jgi:prolyl-tRNA editing enzyme YbaK/EbsC (Cys-tRNA(Pro) deacylase)
MSLDSVRAFFAAHAPDLQIIETHEPTPTVDTAAAAHGVEPGRIAKTLAFRLADATVILLVARGDARIDNKRFKDRFGRGKMLPADEVQAITGHPVGGVCPFGLARPLPVFVDVSLRAFETVLPAAGGVHTAVRIAPEALRSLVAAEWVDVCQTAATA